MDIYQILAILDHTLLSYGEKSPLKLAKFWSNFILFKITGFYYYLAKSGRIAAKFGMWPFWIKSTLSFFIKYFRYVVLKWPFWQFLPKGSMKNFNFSVKLKLHVCSLWWYVSLFAHFFFPLNTFPDRRVVFLLAFLINHNECTSKVDQCRSGDGNSFTLYIIASFLQWRKFWS